MMPGPLSVTAIRKRLAWLGGSGASPLATTCTSTTTSGRIPASSQASSALSTASLTQVSSALRGLSNPSRWRFLVKNSETEISRCRAPISTAEIAGFGLVATAVVVGAMCSHTTRVPGGGQAFGDGRSALLEPDLFQGRRPRIGVDQHQRGLLHPWSHPARPDVLPDRPE